MVKLEFIIFCDKAFTTTGTGNLNLIGIFDVINSSGFPAVHPEFAIVVKVSKDDEENHELSIAIRKGRLTLFENPVVWRDKSFQYIQNFVNFTFPEEGNYEVEIKSDGGLLGRSNLILRRTE